MAVSAPYNEIYKEYSIMMRQALSEFIVTSANQDPNLLSLVQKQYSSNIARLLPFALDDYSKKPEDYQELLTRFSTKGPISPVEGANIPKSHKRLMELAALIDANAAGPLNPMPLQEQTAILLASHLKSSLLVHDYINQSTEEHHDNKKQEHIVDEIHQQKWLLKDAHQDIFAQIYPLRQELMQYYKALTATEGQDLAPLETSILEAYKKLYANSTGELSADYQQLLTAWETVKSSTEQDKWQNYITLVQDKLTHLLYPSSIAMLDMVYTQTIEANPALNHQEAIKTAYDKILENKPTGIKIKLKSPTANKDFRMALYTSPSCNPQDLLSTLQAHKERCKAHNMTATYTIKRGPSNKDSADKCRELVKHMEAASAVELQITVTEDVFRTGITSKWGLIDKVEELWSENPDIFANPEQLIKARQDALTSYNQEKNYDKQKELYEKFKKLDRQLQLVKFHGAFEKYYPKEKQELFVNPTTKLRA